MNYVDRILVRLADPAQRAGVFNDTALAQILSALYDTSAMTIGAPYSPIFDVFTLGVPVARVGTLDGYLQPQGASQATDAHFTVGGIADAATVRVDALWQGRILANATIASSQVSAVSLQWPDASDVDAQIVAALGSLPSDPAALEHERRTRYMTLVEAAMLQPTALTDATFDALLSAVGVTSVGDMIAARGNADVAVARVTFTPPGDPKPVVTLLPVSAALMIFDAGFALADLLAQTKTVRAQLAPQGLGVSVDPKLPARTDFIMLWVVPSDVFNDSDWPGATPALRIANAGTWLANEGIGLLVTA